MSTKANTSKNAESGLDADAVRDLDMCVGKRIVGYSQEPNRGNFATGHWMDDEPLKLTLDDGSTLSISPSGWHDSGGLYVTLTAPAHRPFAGGA